MLQLRGLIDKLESPSFQMVAAIALCAGSGMAVERHRSIRFPTSTMQIWEFVPKVAPFDRKPFVVAVLICKGKLESWVPSEMQDFKASFDHYTKLSKETWAKAKALQAQDQNPPKPVESPESAPATGSMRTVAAPPKTVTLPGMAGIRMISDPHHGKPLTIGGRPVTVAASGR